MSTERKGIMKFAGQDVTIVGADLQAGQTAPEFSVQANDWVITQGLASTQGKVRIIGSLPSLNTSVCDRETQRFNEEASALGEGIVILMVSMDLPYTQKTGAARRVWRVSPPCPTIYRPNSARNMVYWSKNSASCAEPFSWLMPMTGSFMRLTCLS